MSKKKPDVNLTWEQLLKITLDQSQNDEIIK